MRPILIALLALTFGAEASQVQEDDMPIVKNPRTAGAGFAKYNKAPVPSPPSRKPVLRGKETREAPVNKDLRHFPRSMTTEAPDGPNDRIALDLGFGDPPAAKRSEEPPKPRARPKDRENMPAWEREYWASRGGIRPEVERQWEEFERDPQGTMEKAYREHFHKLQRQKDLKKLQKASEGAHEADI